MESASPHEGKEASILSFKIRLRLWEGEDKGKRVRRS